MMSVTLQILFWISLLGILHSYVFYPLLIRILTRNRSLTHGQQNHAQDLPEVVVLMACYNEEAVLDDTLQSIFASEYPQGLFSVWIGSDNSSDASHQIIEDYQSQYSNLHLRVFPGRNGKIRIVNELAGMTADSQAPVVILCDANVQWSPRLMKNLARHFCEEEIGLVAANVVDQRQGIAGIGAEEDAYVGRECLIKFGEGILWGRTMGPFGACYAIRRNHLREIPSHFIVDDFYLFLGCLQNGAQSITDLDAICYEAVSEEVVEEFRRKKRINEGNMQNLCAFWKFLLPWNAGIWTSFAFWSHKGLRWFGPIFLIVMLLSVATLSWCFPEKSLLYRISFFGMIGTFFLSWMDHTIHKKAPPLSLRSLRLVRYFYLMNLALFCGILQFLFKTQSSVWEPTKRCVNTDQSPSGSDEATC